MARSVSGTVSAAGDEQGAFEPSVKIRTIARCGASRG